MFLRSSRFIRNLDIFYTSDRLDLSGIWALEKQGGVLPKSRRRLFTSLCFLRSSRFIRNLGSLYLFDCRGSSGILAPSTFQFFVRPVAAISSSHRRCKNLPTSLRSLQPAPCRGPVSASYPRSRVLYAHVALTKKKARDHRSSTNRIAVPGAPWGRPRCYDLRVTSHLLATSAQATTTVAGSVILIHAGGDVREVATIAPHVNHPVTRGVRRAVGLPAARLTSSPRSRGVGQRGAGLGGHPSYSTRARQGHGTVPVVGAVRPPPRVRAGKEAAGRARSHARRHPVPEAAAARAGLLAPIVAPLYQGRSRPGKLLETQRGYQPQDPRRIRSKVGEVSVESTRALPLGRPARNPGRPFSPGRWTTPTPQPPIATSKLASQQARQKPLTPSHVAGGGHRHRTDPTNL